MNPFKTMKSNIWSHLLCGEPVALSGQKLLKAGKRENEYQLDMETLIFAHGNREWFNKSLQVLLDQACGLWVQHLEGRHDDVFRVSTFQRHREWVTLTEYKTDWKTDRKRDFCIPFSFSPNMVRKTVKLIGPLASLIMASSSSFFTFSWPTERQGWSAHIHGYIYKGHKTLLTHWCQHVPKVVFADDTVSVLVNDCESLCVQDRKIAHCYRSVWWWKMRLLTVAKRWRKHQFNKKSSPCSFFSLPWQL